MPGVTSLDVARESGVSRTTVSYVLNGTQGVTISDATRRRVREAAERLGYTPSVAARALRTGRSDLVLCVLPNWPVGPVIDMLLDHLATDLGDRGLSVLVHHGRGKRPLTELWRAVTPRAVVGFAPFTAEEEAGLARAGIQVVGPLFDDDGGDRGAFAASQAGIGRLQAQHLAAAGHRHLGFAAPTDERLADFSTPRLAGVRAACAELGLPEPVVRAVGDDATSAAAAVRAWHDGSPRVTAVAAYNDEVALALLAGLRTEGLQAPADVAVIGVDDIPAGRLSDPPLTTVAQPIEPQAHHLAAAVRAALDGEPPPPRPRDVSRVVVRGTA